MILNTQLGKKDLFVYLFENEAQISTYLVFLILYQNAMKYYCCTTRAVSFLFDNISFISIVFLPEGTGMFCIR